MNMKHKLFWIFGSLQTVLLALIIFLIFRALNHMHGEALLGLDTQILLSVFYPLFSLLTRYTASFPKNNS